MRDKEAAEKANRAKSEFLSRLSHELRTPLNAVLGFAQILQADHSPGLGDRQRQQVAHIHRAGHHLLSLIEDLLDITRIEIGGLRMHLQAVDAPHETRDALADLRGEAHDRGIRLLFDAPPDLPPLQADPTRFRQVILNLVSNAIKYNRRGGQVAVALQSVQGNLRLSVTDTGLGMTAEQVAALFQPYNRLGRESSAVNGVGIGLAITRQLVELMGGRLDVRSEPGRGSTFTVDLCAWAGAAGAQAQA